MARAISLAGNLTPQQASPSELSGLKEELRKAADCIPPQPAPAVYVLLSYDLVGSSRMKAIPGFNWRLLFYRLYEYLARSLVKQAGCESFRTWKHIGDEVLFWAPAGSGAGLCKQVEGAHLVLVDTIGRLREEFALGELLSLKATAWCVVAAPLRLGEVKTQDGEHGHPNVIVRIGPEGAPTSPVLSTDFLGPDVDLGFRLGRHASRGRLLLSVDLAGLILALEEKNSTRSGESQQKEECLSRRIVIVDYRSIPDVWPGRHYPILWYEPRFDEIQNTFLYDEHLLDPSVSKFQSAKVSTPDGVDQFKKILDQVGLQNRLDDLQKIMADSTVDRDAENEAVTLVPVVLDVHCVAVCFDDKGRVLIAQRPARKRVMPGYWEFGCGQLQAGDTWAACLERSYREDFGIELQWPSGALIPCASYMVDSAQGTQCPGIIFIAGVKPGSEAVAHRHQKLLWVNPNDPKTFPREPKVPDFEKTLQRAQDLWTQVGNG